MLLTNNNPNPTNSNDNRSKQTNELAKRLGIRSASQRVAEAEKNRGTKSVLNQSHFLKLMTTQLKNQDPFKPVDNTQMVAQMAQFSSVAGIKKMSDSMESLKKSMMESQLSKSTQLVGRRVLLKGNTAGRSPSTGFVEGGFRVPKEIADAGLSNVRVVLTTASGEPAHELKLDSNKLGDAPKDGWYQYVWDGVVKQGMAGANDQRYQVSVYATGRGGKEKRLANVASWNTVLGANISKDGGNMLTVDSVGERAMDDVLRVGNAGRAVWQYGQVSDMENSHIKRQIDANKKQADERTAAQTAQIKRSKPRKAVVQGTTKVGQNLRATITASIPDGWTAKYQWRSGSTTKAWGDSNTYSVQSADLGKQVNVRVKLVKGDDESLISDYSDNMGAIAAASRASSPRRSSG